MSTIPKRLLPQTVTIQAFGGTGAYGDIYGDPVTIPARVDRTRHLVQTSAGAQTIAEATIIIQPTTEFPIKSLVTLPGETYTATRGHAVIQSSPKVGARGVHHIELSTT